MQKLYKNDYILVKLHKLIALLDTIKKVFKLTLSKKISILAKIYQFLPKIYFEKRKIFLFIIESII